ncbi:hypothetical protein GCM10009836_49820 [Pseudonocardia ailaonensis]|uniref:Uncharacterized protein n=1 Tax=Pseudonocardia ailaonensis TaxID=367279 RepID=A0ABN2NCT6_9PSEU
MRAPGEEPRRALRHMRPADRVDELLALQRASRAAHINYLCNEHQWSCSDPRRVTVEELALFGQLSARSGWWTEERVAREEARTRDTGTGRGNGQIAFGD